MNFIVISLCRRFPYVYEFVVIKLCVLISSDTVIHFKRILICNLEPTQEELTQTLLAAKRRKQSKKAAPAPVKGKSRTDTKCRRNTPFIPEQRKYF